MKSFITNKIPQSRTPANDRFKDFDSITIEFPSRRNYVGLWKVQLPILSFTHYSHSKKWVKFRKDTATRKLGWRRGAAKPPLFTISVHNNAVISTRNEEKSSQLTDFSYRRNDRNDVYLPIPHFFHPYPDLHFRDIRGATFRGCNASF